MAEANQPQDKKKNKLSLRKILLIIGIILILAFVVVALVISSLIKSSYVTTPTKALHNSGVNATVEAQDLLSYNNGSYAVPYILLNYRTKNITGFVVTATLYTQQPQQNIYILNWTNQCAGCSNMTQFVDSLNKDFNNYSIFNATNSQVQVVSPSSVLDIKQNSVLIVPNGYLPDFMLNNVNGNTTIQDLMNSGTTIIYIGRNFSRLITSQSVLIPDTNPPSFLSTIPAAQYPLGSSYYFNQTSFYFAYGPVIGPISYVNVSKGHIVAFSNFMDSWKSPQDAAADVALAVFQSSWIEQYTSGATSLSVSNVMTESGSVGVLLNATPLGYTPALPSQLAFGYGKVIIEASNNYFANASGTIYRTVYFTPNYNINGRINVSGVIFPGQTATSQMNIYINKSEQVEPHIDIYTTNLTYITSLSPFFSKTITSNYSFLEPLTPKLPSGSYIAELNDFSGEHYASTYFSVPGVNIYLQNVNFSQGTYMFSASAAGQPVSNTSAVISVNNNYQSTVFINDGSFIYTLPIGVSPPTGNLTFAINVSGQTYLYNTLYSPPSVSINKQYIEFIIAIIIVILEITLVKAPTRDDFYIDVPNIPEPDKSNIKIKSGELLGVFDKLNMYYHWRYMPLSNAEFRFAVSNNIRVTNMPVTLTYNNVDLLLDGLTAKGMVVSVDGLYAPQTWIEQSHHDIEYLVIFKKMRVYLVSNAHIFTDLDKSDAADIVTTFHNEKAYVVIYSKTSKFLKNIPVQPPIKTYLAFLNADKVEEFKEGLYMSSSNQSEELKMYIATRSVILLDADNPGALLI